MDFVCCFRPHQSCRGISVLPAFGTRSSLSAVNCLRPVTSLCIRFPTTPFLQYPKFSIKTYAKKKKKNNTKTSIFESKPNGESLIEEESTNEEEEDDDEEDEQVLLEDVLDVLHFSFLDFDLLKKAGDGSGGGGIKLAGTTWDKEALSLAEKACESFNGEIGIYAFKTLPNSTIQVRIERLTNKSGSPTMEDVEAYSKIYRAKLSEAELAKSIPDNISLEVSSPGVERVVRVPQDLERYKERAMYVRYVNEEAESEGDGIFRLVSFDVEAKSCVWGVADIRVNREKAGKGRPLSKKQREWRLETSFESLRLVRLHSEC
ncbi:unnamed protein product [Eruca vesicaria subsp. sativa]|uniref:Ribosome maturation factor RimP N-terminal domain-containing protein n=1 Tax=Eruca vesicaria subsp. sativa TaxID=29727 RepID=A0ABC8KB23_ERUVS|nr:unnamed protein product [Eruca vesicaria subsp. sativa]